MDQMLPSPGFSLSGLGTPMQQLDEDIIGNNPYYTNPLLTTGLTPAGMGSMADSGVGSSGLNTNIDTDKPPLTMGASSMLAGLPSLLGTPGRGSSYQPSYTPTPHSMMQPQTPVCI